MRDWLSVVLAVVVLLAGSRSTTASDWSALRSPADNAKLHSILDSVGVTESDAAVIPSSAPEAGAKDMLWQAWEAIEVKGDYEVGLRLLKGILAYDPDFEAQWPERKVQTRVLPELAGALYGMNDWGRSRPVLELVERMVRLVKPSGDTVWPPMIQRCREKLFASGRTDLPPYVTVNDIPTDDRSTIVDGFVLVPASQFASYSGMASSSDGTGQVTITASGENARSLRLSNGQHDVQGAAGVFSLPVAPRQSGDDMLIPVRAVAEYFGLQVTWEPVPKMAWVSWP